MDVGQDKSGEEGCRTGQMQDWADALQDGWKTRTEAGGMQDKRFAG